MKVSEILNEGEVVAGKFGKATAPTTDIDVPPGFDRFEVDMKDGDKSAWVVGIKGDKKQRISRAPEKLARALVDAYNNHGKSKSGMKAMTMMQAFGSQSENALHDIGIKLTEKPSYWEDFEGSGYAAKRNLNDLTMKKAEKTIGKLKVWTGKEVFGYDSKPNGPLARTKMDPKDLGEIAIVKFDDGTRYLVSTTGANTYIRNWQKID